MKFLNTKEEVIDFQLTSHGKHKLSKGEFKPVYYAFFDDDVLYDGRYANKNESQNNIEKRISEMPRLQTQTIFSGVETNIKKLNNYVRSGQDDKDVRYKRLREDVFPPTPEKFYSLFAPIGTMSPDSEFAPAFSVRVLHGEISGSFNHLAGAYPLERVPQINLDPVDFRITEETIEIPEKKQNSQENQFQTEEFREKGVLSGVHPDGSYIDIEEDYKLLSIEELNGIESNENFEIEVYEVVKSDTARGENECEEVLIPLFFKKKPQEIVNNILRDEEELEEADFELDASFVEYFFKIRVDDEIPENFLCSLPESLRPEEINCEDVLDENDIYRTDVKDEEDC